MTDFNFVTDRVATGAAVSSPDDVRLLYAAGVTHVIDCRREFDDTPLFADAKMMVLWNGTDDDGQPKPADWFQRSLAFALAALAQPKMKVYAHCAAGVNRGPSTAYAILRAVGFTPAQAEKVIRAARPQVGLRYKGDADTAIGVLGY